MIRAAVGRLAVDKITVKRSGSLSSISYHSQQ